MTGQALHHSTSVCDTLQKVTEMLKGSPVSHSHICDLPGTDAFVYSWSLCRFACVDEALVPKGLKVREELGVHLP